MIRIIEECHECELGHMAFYPNRIQAKAEILEVPLFPLALDAMRETVQHISKFENSAPTHYLTCSISYAMTVAKWVCAIEGCAASIATLYNFYIKENKQFSKNRFNFWDVCKEVVGFGNKEDKNEYELLKGEINIIRDFRNLLMHSLIMKFYESEDSSIRLFAKNPYESTIIDVIEASRISIQFFQFFRYTLPPLDLMPTYPVAVKERIAFEKLDVFYKKILHPAFVDMMKKHKLGTRHDLNLKNIRPMAHVGCFRYRCAPVLKAEYKTKGWGMDKSHTCILNKYFNDLIDEKDLGEGGMLMPNGFVENNCDY